MNSDELKGKWKQLKGTIKVEWAKLTDNDLDAIDGRKDILVGKLQEHYGMTTEAAEGAIDAWVNKSVDRKSVV